MTTRTPVLFYQRLLANTLSSPIVFLVSLKHDRLTEDINLTSNNEDITYNNANYQAYPFDLKLPDTPDGMAPRAELTVSNSVGDLIDEFETLGGFREGSVNIILYDPEVKLAGLDFTLNVISSSINSRTVNFKLGYDDFDALPAVAVTRRPENQSGIF